MDQYHQRRVNKPLPGPEIGKTEFFDFKETCSRNQTDEIPAEKSDGNTCKSMNSTRAFKNVNSPAKQKTQNQKEITIPLWRINQNKNNVNQRNGGLRKYHSIENENLQ